jgi:hypothetical protein
MSRFYIGQRIVCVNDSGQNPLHDGVVAGSEYVAIALRAGCPCHPVLVDVGITSREGCTECDRCGTEFHGRWFKTSRFRPIDELETQIERIEVEAAEEVKELQPA